MALGIFELIVPIKWSLLLGKWKRFKSLRMNLVKKRMGMMCLLWSLRMWESYYWLRHLYMSQWFLWIEPKWTNLWFKMNHSGKVCSIIIDGGSCTNVTSKTLINKLQISAKEHTSPYSLQWLRPNDKVTTSRQALIPFFIGLDCGEVICDVLPMDVCHLLLGRLRLFDNHVIYHDHANTYSLKHNGCNLTMTPRPPPSLI